MKQELLKGLTEEQIARVKACKNQEEILALAKEEGIELTEEQLEAVSGGGCSLGGYECPYCYQYNTHFVTREGDHRVYICNDCKKEFKVAGI